MRRLTMLLQLFRFIWLFLFTWLTESYLQTLNAACNPSELLAKPIQAAALPCVSVALPGQNLF